MHGHVTCRPGSLRLQVFREWPFRSRTKARGPDLFLPGNCPQVRLLCPGAESGEVSKTQRQLLLKRDRAVSARPPPLSSGAWGSRHTGSSALPLPGWASPAPPAASRGCHFHLRVAGTVGVQAGDCAPHPRAGEAGGLGWLPVWQEENEAPLPLPYCTPPALPIPGQRKGGLGCRPGRLVAEGRDPAAAFRRPAGWPEWTQPYGSVLCSTMGKRGDDPGAQLWDILI